MFGIGHWEWIAFLLVVLLIFGGKKLPELARGVGKAIREFRKARDELHDTVQRQVMTDEDDGGGDEEGK